jgi:AraC-like DNA-binding protein
MHRRWRVRHCYPQPVVELVRLLLPLHPVREISGLLDIPKSVIYRWRALERVDGNGFGCSLPDTQTISSAVARCDEIGFRFADRPAAANRPLWPALLPAQTLTEAPTPVHETSSPVSDVIASVGDGAALPNAGRDSAEMEPGPCTTEQHYTFEAHKERSTRRVRQRLEAARRLIDAEYFLEIDCRMLADTAQMSRHHFIRMFSQLFGSTPHQYLIQTRVEAAKRLLLASREPIEVIAAGVGFRSGQSLNRAFKQIEGVSVSGFCAAVGEKVSSAWMTTPLGGSRQDHARISVSHAVTAIAPVAFAPSSTC